MYQIFQECSKHSIKCTKCTITFHTTFSLRQNYRLTIIHSQTLQFSCNSFKLSQESCYLYSIYILYRLSIQPQFSLCNSSLNLILSPQTFSQYTIYIIRCHFYSSQNTTTFFSIHFLLKTKNDTQTFHCIIMYAFI